MRFRLLISCAFGWTLSLLGGECVLRIASYNLQNYLIENRLVEGIYRRDYPKPEIEKGCVQKIILRVTPDILGLQEMGDERFLLELQNDLQQAGAIYPYRYWMEAEDKVRHLAVLSKIEAKEVIQHDDLTFNYFGKKTKPLRGVLELVFEGKQGEDWHLFVLHLKSRLTDRDTDPLSELRRLGEATVIRDLIRDRMRAFPERGMLVMGDFNDSIASRSLSRFLFVGQASLLHLVEMFDSRGEVWTHFYRSREVYSRVDFILVNQRMTAGIEGMERAIEDNDEMAGSDHRLIWLEFASGK